MNIPELCSGMQFLGHSYIASGIIFKILGAAQGPGKLLRQDPSECSTQCPSVEVFSSGW